MNKLKFAFLLALMVTMSAIFIVGGLSIVTAESSGSAMAATAVFPVAITVAAAITLVMVGALIVLRRRRETITGNVNSYNPQPFNFGDLSNGPMQWWHSGEAAFAVRYCDKCGNRL